MIKKLMDWVFKSLNEKGSTSTALDEIEERINKLNERHAELDVMSSLIDGHSLF